MIITTAIALSVIKGLILNSPTTTSTDTTTTIITEKSLPEKQHQQNELKCEDEKIPYVSVADCNACPAPCTDQDHLHYPSYLKMDYETPLLHSMKPYTRHVLISTGKDDWEHSIDEEKDSLAPHLQKAIDEGQQRLKAANDGEDVPRIVLTNSSRRNEDWEGPGWQVIILPDHIVVNNVTSEQCHDFFEAFLKPAVGTVDYKSENYALIVEKDQGVNGHHHLNGNGSVSTTAKTQQSQEGSTSISAIRTVTTTTTSTTTTSLSSSSPHSTLTSSEQQQDSKHHHRHHHSEDVTRKVTAGNTTFLAYKWQPKAAVMICSHRKRDKRCGVTAPILKDEFTRILRSKDIYGDCEGDVEIWLISHIGGHKFAGNVIVHKSEGMAIWYGRVEPCHAQAIVDMTIEKGEVIEELYRGSMIGSFDQSRKKIAW
ncbi:hypothetical protein BGX27_008475 [Mortierella sp. AM989]|nr:hypothetical protein BGX27_008475 [Mortierella sp. AM989]